MPTSTRQALLQALSAAGGDYVSGQQLADLAKGCGAESGKLGELALIFQGYETLLARSGMDPSDRLELAGARLEEALARHSLPEFLRDRAVFIDEFDTFNAPKKRLLAALLREPSYIPRVRAQLPAEKFLLPQQKELYQAMLDCQAQGIEVSLSTLRGFVQSEEALNELSRLAAQYSDVNCTIEDINFYLERIARGTPIAKKAAQMSNEDLEQYLQSMREKKQGTLPAED